MKVIKDKTGVYMELPKDKIKFVSKEAEAMFDLSMENDYLENEIKELKKQLSSKTLQLKKLTNKIDKAIEIIESCNLGIFDYSIDQLGIIKLLEILKDSDVDV